MIQNLAIIAGELKDKTLSSLNRDIQLKFMVGNIPVRFYGKIAEKIDAVVKNHDWVRIYGGLGKETTNSVLRTVVRGKYLGIQGGKESFAKYYGSGVVSSKWKKKKDYYYQITQQIYIFGKVKYRSFMVIEKPEPKFKVNEWVYVEGQIHGSRKKGFIDCYIAADNVYGMKKMVFEKKTKGESGVRFKCYGSAT